MRTYKFILAHFFLMIVSSSFAAGVNRLTGEAGLVYSTYNTVGVPGDDGTTFNMRKSLPKESVYYRLDFKRLLGEKHGMRFLYAPLRVTGDRSYGKDINFNGAIFQANQKTKTLYQFNSYRATYFYQLINREQWKLNLGVTAKVRDAQIQLKQNGLKKNRSDLGVVPLFYLWSEYDLSQKIKMTFDFDGLAAPQGRAFDVALSVGYKFKPDLSGNIGYRVLEGGVDNDKVYNFSQFNFLFASVDIQF